MDLFKIKATINSAETVLDYLRELIHEHMQLYDENDINNFTSAFIKEMKLQQRFNESTTFTDRIFKRHAWTQKVLSRGRCVCGGWRGWGPEGAGRIFYESSTYLTDGRGAHTSIPKKTCCKTGLKRPPSKRPKNGVLRPIIA